MKPEKILTGLITALLATAGVSDAQNIISVNFIGGQGTGGPGADSVTGSAGAVPAVNWNNLVNPSDTALSLVTNANAAGATITYSSPNTWAATGIAPGGGSNASLMSGYLDNLQNGGSISVSGLGAAFTGPGYSVLVYQNSDSAGSWGYSATDGTTTDSNYGLQTAGGGGNYPLAGPNGFVEGTSTDPAGGGIASNYVTLGNFTGSSFTITALSGTTGDGRIRPNGFQVVAVPEPGAAMLAFAGVAGLLGLRRRRS